MLQDEFTVAYLMAVELKARHAGKQWLEKRLALDELASRDVPTVEMQEIESVIDELHIALPVGRCLGVGESRQPSLIDAAKFPVEISGLDIQVRERCDGAWIFFGPVEAGPSQQLHAPVVDARRHAIAVQFDLMQPLRPGRWLLDWLGKLRSDEGREGRVAKAFASAR